ncbi:hydroxyacylglutathione hydrolase [Geminocystis sp. CENA526]|uniref:hydroxyacylglutathione hydrolase n=1 Tax=Geminocystis sp. CENA526 TaxID=1355871 RepID=UPI003D6E5233
MKIIRIPVLSDNYIFLLHDINNNEVAVVDPAEAKPVLAEIEKCGGNLVAIFNTHHHFDHVGGNKELLEHYPNAVVYGGEKDKGRIPRQQVFLKEGDTVDFAGRKANIYFVPGHTYAHIAYYFPPTEDSDWGELFCGDTLFAGGCGRLFEGTPTDMVNSLTKFRNLPDSTRVWCAHEYTLSNLKFAITVDGDNPDLQKRYEQVKIDRTQNIATVPSSIEIEKLTNPFLRWDNPKIKQAMGFEEATRVFGRLRGMKDNF